MKLMAGISARSKGFALPTVVLVSTVTLIILVAAVSAAAASRVALDSQFYNELAQQAVESGIARANECLKGSGYTPQWSTAAAGRDLRPNSDCTGGTLSGSFVSPYVHDGGSSNIRTRYSIDAPTGSGIGSALKVIGTTELVRASSPNSVWRRYEQVSYLRIEPVQETLSCNSLNIGDTGPGGGIIFYKVVWTQPHTCYEAAPQGWYPATAPSDPAIEWGCYNTDIPGADGEGIAAGKQNTMDIIAAGCTTSSGDKGAAIVASEYSGGGRTDWYLPSRSELLQLYAQRDVVGGMDAVYYQASTEYNATLASVVHFNTGQGLLQGKHTSPRLVRPIRSFTVDVSAPGSIACPEGFIGVPGNPMFATADFCVGKYEAKNVGGKAGSQPGGAPIVDITQTAAAVAAAEACSGCRLIGEREWLTIAHNVLGVASNWSGGAVGSGYVYRGHSDGSPPGPLEASTDDSNGYFGTGDTSGDQRRTLTLSNGEVIWDFAGNASEWTSATVSGVGAQPGGSGYTWREWNAIGGTGNLAPNPFPVFGTPAAGGWTSIQGIGRVHSSSSMADLRGFIRGGNAGDGTNAGIFSLGLDNDPIWARPYIGFRIVR